LERAKTEALQGELATLQSDLAACKERLRAETDKYENERRKRKALARSNGAEAVRALPSASPWRLHDG
jgi:hypothetical protein